MSRQGLGRGQGKGYKNIVGRDPHIHSQSARGVKQPQRILTIPHNEWREITKININDYPLIKENILNIKNRINEKGVDVAFKPLPDEYEGKFGVSRKVDGTNVRIWFPSQEMQMCCFVVDGVEVQIYTHLNKNEYRIQKIARVQVLSSTPTKITPSI